MAGSNASVGSKHRLVGFNVCLLQSKEVLVDTSAVSVLGNFCRLHTLLHIFILRG